VAETLTLRNPEGPWASRRLSDVWPSHPSAPRTERPRSSGKTPTNGSLPNSLPNFWKALTIDSPRSFSRARKTDWPPNFAGAPKVGRLRRTETVRTTVGPSVAVRRWTHCS
jgi:hypothetical protein